jgi:hypothetical protein
VWARQLIGGRNALDGTRPVTLALAEIHASNTTGFARLLAVAGYNYLEQYYSDDHVTYPQRIILVSM